ncbi:MAG: hypothetical protein C5B50_08940 [Verrucomicrobia bacterium]|nr:MAG: hypothetical protein C5B50_08940 [Verrucomicrobiota bacterium]
MAPDTDFCTLNPEPSLLSKLDCALPISHPLGNVNVLHVFPYSPRISGGHSNAIRNFIQCQRPRGINAVAIAPRTDSPVALDWGFPLLETDLPAGLQWEALDREFGLRVGNTVVHLHNVERAHLPFLSQLHSARVPHVYTSHGQLNFRGVIHWLKKFVYLHLLDSGPRRAGGIHLLTQVAAQRLPRLLPRFHGPVLVQGNLADVAALAATPPCERSEFGLPADVFVLLFLGRLDVHVKGLDFLLRAYAALPAEKFRLVMAGPEWQAGRAQLDLLARELGCRDRIHFTGPLYGEKKWGLLRLADAFVSPSRWDAFPVAMIEAMAAGLPVVTSNKIGPAQEFAQAQAALVVPLDETALAQAIAKLEAEPEERKALAQRGRAWAELNCSPERAGARFGEFYEAVLTKTN